MTTTLPLPTDPSTILKALAPDLPARGRAQLTATDLCLNRGGRQVLNRATLRVTAGSRWAVVGENGRGKTTLLRAVAGRLPAESGEVRRVGTLGLVDQDLPAPPGRRVGHLLDATLAAPRAALHALDAAALSLADGGDAAEHAYSAALEAVELLDAWDAERRLGRALDALEACQDRDRPLSELSVGQRYRIRLACLLGAEHDFLLLDEPTNHLDADALAFLTRALREHRGGVVLVSHDRALLADVATDVLDLEPTVDGVPRVHGGGYAGLAEARRRERQRWQQQYDSQQAEHGRLERAAADATARLSTGWRPDKGTGKHQRQSHAPGLVQAVRRRQDALEAARVDIPPPPPVFAFPSVRARPGRTLLFADRVQVAGRLDRSTTVALEAGSRLVLTGPNGAGKSTLLTLLAGRLAPTHGEVRRAAGVRVALLAQEGNDPDGRSAAETYRAHSDRLVAAGLLSSTEQVSAGSLGLLDTEAWRTPTRRLSTGQQRRLDLAMQLAARPDVLLLDEPTNHLSATLVDELTAALETTAAAVVIATHDRQLLRDTASWPRLELTTG